MADKKRGDVKDKMCKFLSEKKNCLSRQKKSLSQFIKDKRAKGRQRSTCSDTEPMEDDFVLIPEGSTFSITPCDGFDIVDVIPISHPEEESCLTSDEELEATESPDTLPQQEDISIINTACLGNAVEIKKLQLTMFGSDIIETAQTTHGLFVLDHHKQIQPLLNERLLQTLDTVESNLCAVSQSPWKPISVFHFNDCLRLQSSQLSLHSESQPCTSKIIHIHNHIYDDSFPLRYLLEPQFFSLKKPVLVFPCNLQSITSSCTQYVDELMYQVALASTAHFSSPHVILPFTDFNDFKFNVCFGDEDLANDAYKEIRFNILAKCRETFQYNDHPPNITSFLLENDGSQAIPQDTFHSGSGFLSWNQFSLLMYIKACSLKFNLTTISYIDFLHIASLFTIPLEDTNSLLEQLQTLQLILMSPNRETIIIDTNWFYSCLSKVGNLSKLVNPQRPYLFNARRDVDQILTCSIDAGISDDFLKCVLDQHHLVTTSKSASFTTLLLPSYHQSSFHCIDSVYLLPYFGIMPPGFFERLTVLLWQTSQLSLKKCKCRFSAIYEINLDKKGLSTYNIKICNDKGFIRVSLSNAYNKDVPYTTLCSVASIVLEEIKKAVVQLLPAEKASKGNVMTIFLECQDLRCRPHPGKKHLTRVYSKHLKCTQESHYKQELNQLKPSQSFWINNLVKDQSVFNIEQDYVFKGITIRPPSNVSDELDLSSHSPYLSQCTVSHSETEKKIKTLEHQHEVDDTSWLVERFLHQQSLNIYDNLDLKCRSVLYQAGILKCQSDLDIIAQGDTMLELDRKKAIDIIVKAVSIARVRGVMALVSAVKTDIRQGDQDDHAVLHKSLISDPNYDRIKSEWLHHLIT